MTNSTPYSKKGERWVNHTVAPGSYVVNDPRPPPPPPPPYHKPTGQNWARQPPPPPPPNNGPPRPLAIPPNGHPPGQLPPPAAIPPAFQTPPGKTPRFYDPDDFRKFTETHGQSSSASFPSSYPTAAPDAHGRSFLPLVGEIQKRGPYSERLTRAEEVELLKTCIKYKETFNAPSSQNKWWQVVAADFSVYRRSLERSDLQAPTAKRRVELAYAKRKKEIEEGKDSDEPEDYLEAINAWVEHNDKLESGEIQALSSKQAAEVKLDEAIERIKKEREVVEKEHPMASTPSSATSARQPSRLSTGMSNGAPVVIPDSPPRQAPAPLPPYVPAHPSHYAPPAQPLTHHGVQAPAEVRPAKRQRNDDGSSSNSELTAVVAKLGPAIDSMGKLASEMYEWRKSEREAREAKRQRRASANSDAEMNGTSETFFSPAPGGSDPRVEELERKLQEQREANEALQTNLEEITTKITAFTEEATAAEKREKDRDTKIDKILQVLKKHFQGTGTGASSSQS